MAGERAPPRDGRRGCCVFSEDFNESSGALRSPAGDEVEEHFGASSATRAFRAAFVHFVDSCALDRTRLSRITWYGTHESAESGSRYIVFTTDCTDFSLQMLPPRLCFQALGAPGRLFCRSRTETASGLIIGPRLHRLRWHRLHTRWAMSSRDIDDHGGRASRGSVSLAAGSAALIESLAGAH